MKEFTIIDSITFNEKKFKILEGNNLIYMLEEDDQGNLLYPKYEDYILYIKLQNIINSPMLLNLETNDEKNIKDETYINEYKNKRINIIPKVLYKGMLITLTSALLLSGCAQTGNINPVENPESNTQAYVLQLEEEGQKNGYHIDASDFNVPFIKSGFVEDFKNDTYFCRNSSEFAIKAHITGEYTYDDVRKCFEENESIPQQFKDYIFEGLDNMEEELPCLNLTALYYNASRIKFIEVNAEQMGSDTTLAKFNIGNQSLLYNPEISNGYEKFTIAHEVLGHGSLESTCVADGQLVYYGFMTPIVVEVDDNVVQDKNIGVSYTEAAANMLARIASKEEFTNIYNYAEEELRIIQKRCNLTTDELFNSRGINLYEKMYKNDIDNPISIAIQSDTLLYDYRLRDFDKIRDNHEISNLIESLVADAYEEDYEETNSLTEVEEVMNNSIFGDELELLNPNDRTTVIDTYSPSESFQKVKKLLNE